LDFNGCVAQRAAVLCREAAEFFMTTREKIDRAIDTKLLYLHKEGIFYKLYNRHAMLSSENIKPLKIKVLVEYGGWHQQPQLELYQRQRQHEQQQSCERFQRPLS
jgi:hypothetical protein